MKRPPSEGNLDAGLVRLWSLGEPDEGLDSFHLTEEEPEVPLVGVIPVFQQSSGDTGHARISRLTPGVHPRPDLVDQGYLHEYARIVEGLGAAGGDHVASRPPTFHQIEEPGIVVVPPMLIRLIVGGVDDQGVYGILSHQTTSMIFRLSIPRSSTIFTAIRRLTPGLKGRETVPR